MTKPLTPYLIDYETQAIVPISNPEYTSHRDTRALCMSWGPEGYSGSLWWPCDPPPPELVAHVEAGGMLGASYARFDSEIWENIAVRDHGFPKTKPEQWFCTQAQSRVAGLPSALDKSARALGRKQRKSATGAKLISKCCIPPFSQDPQDYADLGAYCLQDWVVMDDVSMSIPELSERALIDYQCNERINDRGIKIDRELALAAQQYAEAELSEINAKLIKVSCEYITKSTQHKRVATWLRECLEDDGLDDVIKLMVRHKTDKETGETKRTYSSDKNVRANMLAGHEEHIFVLPNDIVELLNLMTDAGGTAVSKFSKMGKRASRVDDRVRGILRYAGAPSTIRYTSIDLQVHNLRRDVFNVKDDGFEPQFLIDQVKRGEVLRDKAGKPLSVMDSLGRLLRSAIIPEAGKVFVVGDWASVESRMTAYLAGDEDKLNMFRRGEDPYCYAASGIYGRTITKADEKERQVGKVTDLACGFLGGEKALLSMAAGKRIYIDPDKLQDIVDGYRAASPKIVALGNALLAAAKRAVTYPNTKQAVDNITYFFDSEDGALYCHLPDGETVLRYPECRFEEGPAPWDKNKTIIQLTALKASFTPKADAKEWIRHSLWRGLLLENVVQAQCAKLLRDAILQCEDEDLPVIFHVHDEIILEVPKAMAEFAKKRLQEIMETIRDYIQGLPLVAEPKIMLRYGK